MWFDSIKKILGDKKCLCFPNFISSRKKLFQGKKKIKIYLLTNYMRGTSQIYGRPIIAVKGFSHTTKLNRENVI